MPIVQSTTYTFDSSDDIAAAFKPNTKALFGEIIANPAMSVFDVEKFARIDHGQGVPLIVDAGTFDYASGRGLTLVRGHADSSIGWGSEIMNHGQKELLRGVPPAGGRPV